MNDEVTFVVTECSLGFTAKDSNGNVGFGSSVDEAIADLQLAYDDADFDVCDFVFTPE